MSRSRGPRVALSSPPVYWQTKHAPRSGRREASASRKQLCKPPPVKLTVSDPHPKESPLPVVRTKSKKSKEERKKTNGAFAAALYASKFASVSLRQRNLADMNDSNNNTNIRNGVATTHPQTKPAKNKTKNPPPEPKVGLALPLNMAGVVEPRRLPPLFLFCCCLQTNKQTNVEKILLPPLFLISLSSCNMAAFVCPAGAATHLRDERDEGLLHRASLDLQPGVKVAVAARRRSHSRRRRFPLPFRPPCCTRGR